MGNRSCQNQVLTMIKHALVGLLCLSSIYGCKPISNQHNELSLRCGTDIKAGQRYLILDGADSSALEAVILRNQSSLPVRFTSKSCLELPPGSSEGGMLYVRTREGLGALRLDLSADLPILTSKRLEQFGLIGLETQRVQFSCPGDRLYTDYVVDLKQSNRPSDHPVLNLNTYRLFDDSGIELVSQNLDHRQISSISLQSLPEGAYRLDIRSRDGFEQDDQSQLSSCNIYIDRSPPLLTSTLADAEYYRPPDSRRQLAPGAAIHLRVQDHSPYEILYCLKESGQGDCRESEFQTYRTLVAPEKGIWQLEAYAIDAAGLHSDRILASFAVFHQDQIDNIRLLVTNSQLSGRLNRSAEGLASLKQANQEIKTLSLEKELWQARWPFLEGLWAFDQISSLSQQVPLSLPPVSAVIAAPDRDAFVTLDQDKNATLWEAAEPVASFSEVEQLSFGSDQRLWYTHAKGVLGLWQRGVNNEQAWEVIPQAKLASSPDGNRVVAWNRSELLVIQDDQKEPLFRFKFPKPTRFFGRVTFSDQDHLIYHTDERLGLIDLGKKRIYQPYLASKGCIIKEFALYSAQEIYFISRWNAAISGPPPANPQNPCGLKKLILQDHRLQSNNLSGTYSIDYRNLSDLKFNLGHHRRFLTFNNQVDRRFFFLDLDNPSFGAIPINLEEDEYIEMIAPASAKEAAFFVRTSKRAYRLRYIEGIEDFSPWTGISERNCEVQAIPGRLLCLDETGRYLRIYQLADDHRLIPQVSIKSAATDYAAKPSLLISASARSNALAYADRSNRTLYRRQQAQGEDWQSYRLENDVDRILIAPSGWLAVLSKDLTITMFSPGIGLVPTELELDASVSKVIDWGFDAKQNLWVLELLDHKRQVSIYNTSTLMNRLTASQIFPLPEGLEANRLIVHPSSDHAIAYKELAENQSRSLFLIDAGTPSSKVLEADNAVARFSQDDRSIFLIRGPNLYQYDLANEQSKLLSTELSANTNEILDNGRILLYRQGFRYLRLSDHQIIADDAKLYSLAEDLWLHVAANGGGQIKILSPQAEQSLLDINLQIIANAKQIITTSDSPDIVVIAQDDDFGAAFRVKRFSIELFEAQSRLDHWTNYFDRSNCTPISSRHCL